MTNPIRVRALSKVVDVTLSTDTSAYISGDLLADTQIMTDAFWAQGGTGTVTSITVIDEDDQGQALDVVFLRANNTLGTENSAPTISDANARDILGYVNVPSANYIDLGGVRVASVNNIRLGVQAASGTSDLYVAAISRGTGTYTASGLKLRIHIQGD